MSTYQGFTLQQAAGRPMVPAVTEEPAAGAILRN